MPFSLNFIGSTMIAGQSYLNIQDNDDVVSNIFNNSL